MDDKNFDQPSALEWIGVIENPSASVREIDIYPLLRSWLSGTSSKNLLDIGCGQGICSAHLDKQIEYIGVDPSRELIKRANELYAASSRAFVEGNAYELPFEDKKFGAAFSIAVWHLLSDISKASAELSRILSDKGAFLIITADPAQYKTWMERYEHRALSGCQFIGTNRNANGSTSSDTLYFYTLEEIVENLSKKNLKVTSVQVVRTFIAISGFKV